MLDSFYQENAFTSPLTKSNIIYKKHLTEKVQNEEDLVTGLKTEHTRCKKTL